MTQKILKFKTLSKTDSFGNRPTRDLLTTHFVSADKIRLEFTNYRTKNEYLMIYIGEHKYEPVNQDRSDWEEALKQYGTSIVLDLDSDLDGRNGQEL